MHAKLVHHIIRHHPRSIIALYINVRHKPTSPLRKQFPKPAQIGLVPSTIRSYLPATGGIFADMPFVEAITRKHYLRYPSS